MVAIQSILKTNLAHQHALSVDRLSLSFVRLRLLFDAVPVHSPVAARRKSAVAASLQFRCTMTDMTSAVMSRTRMNVVSHRTHHRVSDDGSDEHQPALSVCQVGFQGRRSRARRIGATHSGASRQDRVL